MGGFQVQSDDALSSARVTYENGGSNASAIIPKDGGKLSVGTHLSGLTPYHLLEGSVQVLNTTSTPAVSNVMYTGTGAALDVNIGMDMDSQWGNLPSERFGGLTLIRGTGATDTVLVDTVRGPNGSVPTLYWNDATVIAGSRINSFSSTGFQVAGGNTNVGGTGVIFQSLSFGTNRRRSGTTNHGMSFTEHYNMESGFTILSWSGSGKDRHEIPHMLGRKFDFYMIKNLTTGTVSYQSNYEGQLKGYYLTNNTTAFETHADNIDVWTTDSLLNVSNTDKLNNSGQNYICYAWCSAKVDADNKLIGNYEIIRYNGATVNVFIKTKAKPLAVIFKELSSTGTWSLLSVKNGLSNVVPLNDNTVGNTPLGVSFTFSNEGISFASAWKQNPGTDYIAIVIYDNDNGSGKSMYNRSTDSSTLNLVNARVPFASGLDSSGSAKISTLNRNELVSSVTLFPGKNYLSMNNIGVYSNTTYNPNYNVYSGFGDYYESNRNKWYKNVSIVSDNFTSDTLANYTAENASLSIVNGKLKVQNTGTNITGKAKRSFTTVVGKRYALVYDFNSTYVWSGVGVGNTDGNNELLLFNTSTDYNGKGVKYFTATQTTSYLNLYTSNFTGHSTVFDHIAIYPVNSDNTVDLSNATEILDSRNYLDTIVYADHNLQPVMVEKLYKPVYNKDIVLTGNVDLVNVDKINSDKDYNLNINGKKKLTVTENNGILNQDGKALTTGGQKNFIINGNMSIWQRGTSFSGISGGQAVSDMWRIDPSDSSGNYNVTQYLSSNLIDGKLVMSTRLYINTVGTNSYYGWSTFIEDTMRLAGKLVTLSFYMASDSTAPIYIYFGRKYSVAAGRVYNNGFYVGNGNGDLTKLQKYTVTYRVPDYASETYVQSESNMCVVIRQMRNTVGEMRLANVQLEEGSIATSFEERTYQQELAMCQRYYYQLTINRTLNIQYGTSNVSIPVIFPVTMRTTPTVNFISGTNGTGTDLTQYGHNIWYNTSAGSWTPANTIYGFNAEMS